MSSVLSCTLPAVFLQNIVLNQSWTAVIKCLHADLARLKLPQNQMIINKSDQSLIITQALYKIETKSLIFMKKLADRELYFWKFKIFIVSL